MRLIDADEFIKRLKDDSVKCSKKLSNNLPEQEEEFLKWAIHFDGIYIDCINAMPTIDTEKHGLWKIEQENIVVPMYCFTCSVCGEMFCDEDKYIVASMHYCMNCGAKMDFFWKRGE